MSARIRAIREVTAFRTRRRSGKELRLKRQPMGHEQRVPCSCCRMSLRRRRRRAPAPHRGRLAVRSAACVVSAIVRIPTLYLGRWGPVAIGVRHLSGKERHDWPLPCLLLLVVVEELIGRRRRSSRGGGRRGRSRRRVLRPVAAATSDDSVIGRRP